jgi:hypothetical protein
MGEVVFFDGVSTRSCLSLPPPAQQMSYETYVAYQQAESAFRALYSGTTLETDTPTDHPSTEIMQRHWSTVQELAETLLREKSLSREQVLKLLLQASLDVAVGAEP